MVQVQITDLRPDDEQAIEQIAALLVRGFREHWPGAWPDMHSALMEVAESFGEGRISRVARDAQGSVVGWIGGIPQYDGKVWELHPLVEHEEWQGKGGGRGLVRAEEGRGGEEGRIRWERRYLKQKNRP